MEERTFGDINNYLSGALFATRKELSESRVHRPTQAGISGSENDGADSVVLSGGYDDIDNGDEIIYTGHGGQDVNTGKQISDQTLTRQNKALVLSHDNGLPVRVVRGASLNSLFAPKTGYRYDGLYLVDDYWKDTHDGFVVYRYRLVKMPEAMMPPTKDERNDPIDLQQPKRIQVTTLRIIRDTKKSLQVKKLYDYRCQVCGTRIDTLNGPYAEGAHIKPLGAPHNGPDEVSNILCLCPNHHVLFDLRGFSINDDFTMIGIPGKLNVVPEHMINPSCLRYRREHY